ncbi:MAG: fructose-bisphosphate aldolase class I [Proteobacteria bacterium]|nr:fructose-bisphosphate aldolase class I [Pseudomonadota bacterium]
MAIVSSTVINELKSTIKAIAVSGKGLLAADESTGTISKRFNALNIACTEESRRNYRELLLTTPSLEKYISGVILYEETLYQKSTQDISFPELLMQKKIIPGIKVDKGLIQLPGTDEKSTQGLDGLFERLKDYKAQGARFAKWRAIYSIAKNTPSRLAIQTNAEDLARYAAICQETGIVPIIEPEVLIDGDHTLDRCFNVSAEVLHTVFHKLYTHKVLLECVILKPSMVTPGNSCLQQISHQDIAEATISVLKQTVPSAVPTINFLSGGQSPLQAIQNLNAMHQNKTILPWNLSFSFARALQEPCMNAWLGKAENRNMAQEIFSKQVKLASLASVGKYEHGLESKQK